MIQSASPADWFFSDAGKRPSNGKVSRIRDLAGRINHGLIRFQCLRHEATGMLSYSFPVIALALSDIEEEEKAFNGW